jgi:hypothetical protein
VRVCGAAQTQSTSDKSRWRTMHSQLPHAPCLNTQQPWCGMWQAASGTCNAIGGKAAARRASSETGKPTTASASVVVVIGFLIDLWGLKAMARWRGGRGAVSSPSYALGPGNVPQCQCQSLWVMSAELLLWFCSLLFSEHSCVCRNDQHS